MPTIKAEQKDPTYTVAQWPRSIVHQLSSAWTPLVVKLAVTCGHKDSVVHGVTHPGLPFGVKVDELLRRSRTSLGKVKESGGEGSKSDS